MNRYIAIQREAAEEIVGNRLLQTADFELGERLGSFLSGADVDLSSVVPRLVTHTGASGAGIIVTYSGVKTPIFTLFDLEESRLFGRNQEIGESVQSFQKVLRFCVKYWSKRLFSPTEFIYPSYAKAVVFPFPISQKTGFRISIDLNPDADRLERRGQTERYLLVYKSGREENQGPSETPSFTVFRKFIEDLRKVNIGAQVVAKEEAAITSFRGVSVGVPPGRLDIHQGYDLWMRALTSDQRRFVEAGLATPMRIEGPAGTGKTLCLALKAVYGLRASEEAEQENSSLFVTHSEASRRSIISVLQSMDADRFINPSSPFRYLRIATLQGLCSKILHQELSDTELLDPDAYDAKQLQLLYVEDALRRAKEEFETYKKFLSASFCEFIESEDEWAVVQMLQHEIAVIIKGRANEQFDAYKRVPALKSGLPLSGDGDKGFVWRIYELYREQLVSSAQFDTDDVMLSALGQLSTPIWRRRRAREGYDCIYIDETHLFNMNELSIFHHLTKREDRFQIAFAIDRSQAIGDRGWVDDFDLETLVPVEAQRSAQSKVKMSTVFRCSPEIVNLAFAITSSGASIFTNFEDPLVLVNSSQSFEEERMCEPPAFELFDNDESLVDGSYDRAERMSREMSSSRGDIAVIAFTEELFRSLIVKAELANKPVEVLKERGNIEVVNRARQSGRFVLSMPDYIGGLEFDGVVLVGVDRGRVPQASGMSQESRAFLNFIAHNRLYVAITRARYRVLVTAVRTRGLSPILNAACASKAIKELE